MEPISIMAAMLMAVATALWNGATDYHPVSDPEVWALFTEAGQYDNPNARYDVLWLGEWSGTGDEMNYVIVYSDLTIEVGP